MPSSRLRLHRHAPLPGSHRGNGGGIPYSHCNGSNRPCNVTGAHVTVVCRCGSTGTICPQRKRIYWTTQEGR